MLEMLQKIEEIILAEDIETPEQYKEAVDVCAIRYRSDDCEVVGYVAWPKEMKDDIDVIIFNRGGNREFGALKPEGVCRYAEHGYIVLGSQYRGNMGGTGVEGFGGRDVNDVIELINIALKLPVVKKEKVYMLGRSRGGLMTYKACTMDERIEAAAVLAGVADSVMMYETREDAMKQVYHELVGGSPKECPEEFRKRSAVCWADKIIPPIMIGQGTDDWRVVPEQAYKMDEALKKAGKEHVLIVYPGGDHSLNDTTAAEDALRWFEEHPISKRK